MSNAQPQNQPPAEPSVAPHAVEAAGEPGRPQVGPPRPRLSWKVLLITFLGQALAGLLVARGTALLTSALKLAPERALVIAGALGLLVALSAGFLAATLVRRIGAKEIFLSGLVFVVVGSALLAQRLLAPLGTFDPSWNDIAYLANLLGNPIGGVVLAGVVLWWATFIGASLGFLFAGGGRLDFGFSYELFVARSHLRLRKKSPTKVMTVISMGGVTVGVLALTVVLSVMSGFEEDLKEKIIGTNAHAVVLKYGNEFADWQQIGERVRKVNGVAGVTPFILNEVMVSSEQNLAGSLIKGIDPASISEVSNLPANMQEGRLEWLDHPEQIRAQRRFRYDSLGLREQEDGAGAPEAPMAGEGKAAPTEKPGQGDAVTEDDILGTPKPGAQPGPMMPGIVLGKELAQSLKVMVGDRVNVVSPLGGELGPTGPMPKSRPFRVAGIFFSGMYEYDAKFAYISLSEAQRFFGLGESVTGLELKTDDIDNTRQITRTILNDLDGYPYRTRDWGEMNKNLFSALRLEKLVMAVILGFIVLVACFNIVSTLIMMVLEKSKEIAILKSMGATDNSVMKIFVAEGLIIGFVGTAVGLVLGFVACIFVAKVGIHLDAEVYYIDKLPVKIDGMQFAAVAFLAVLLSYLATIYPASRASRLPPVDGLRND